jgi:O-antigen/teichoic acid export membrane protein
VLARLITRPSGPTPDVAVDAASGRRVERLNVLAQLQSSAIWPGRLFAVFAALVGSQLSGAVFGLVYWTLAARALAPEQVGVGAALVAAMTLLSAFGVLGIGTLLLERVPVVSATDRRALLSTGFAIAGLGGVLVAGGWVGVYALVHLSGVLGDLSLGTALLLVGTTGIAAICLAFDQAVIGMGISSMQVRRNMVASIIRIAVLSGAIVLGVKSGQTILISWTVGFVGSLITARLRRYLPPRARVSVRQRWNLVRNYWTVAIGHHGLTLTVSSSSLIVSVVVASLMSATQTAYFQEARLLGDTIIPLPYLLTIALFATAGGMEGFRRKAPRTLVVGLALSLAIIVGGALFGRVLLSMFGTNYAKESWPILLLLLSGGPALVIKDHFVVLRRLQGRRNQGILATGLWTAAELAGAITGGLFGGMKMLCIGWLGMSAVCALVALPTVLKATRRAAGVL